MIEHYAMFDDRMNTARIADVVEGICVEDEEIGLAVFLNIPQVLVAYESKLL